MHATCNITYSEEPDFAHHKDFFFFKWPQVFCLFWVGGTEACVGKFEGKGILVFFLVVWGLFVIKYLCQCYNPSG